MNIKYLNNVDNKRNELYDTVLEYFNKYNIDNTKQIQENINNIIQESKTQMIQNENKKQNIQNLSEKYEQLKKQNNNMIHKLIMQFDI